MGRWSPISFTHMFETALTCENDVWHTINIANNESIPEDILSYEGIVLTGSRFNIRDQLPWFEQLCELIRTIALRGTPNLYGGCFGCQIIAHALGGKVDYNPTKRFVLKYEQILFDLTLISHIPIELPETLKIIASHGDCVVELPENATRIASSVTCENEVFIAGKYQNILACQSHPEFEFTYAIAERIWVSVVEISKRLNEEEIVASRASFQDVSRDDSNLFCSFISYFLRRSVMSSEEKSSSLSVDESSIT